ncbi:MAG TPA: ABC transporter permease [Clostridia bacterium]|jgi:putative ABC transport system permease protein|nr:ABC transporter permease [Clostridia bacterium]HPY43622.1 ABC transporter permease [Clostridia bacterium]HQA97136.1 ABC transporter permease [Clostridia bacterium]HQO54897.1 ABC transporter permease [Clostridia bacterium]
MASSLYAFYLALPSTLEQGLIYALLALGVMITYLILDFPDLTVDGSFPLGGAVSTALILQGVSPALALLAATASGMAAGLCTGLIHVKLKIRALFSGIIMMTALYSINLRIAGGSSLLSIPRTSVTLFRNNALVRLLPQDTQILIISLILVVMVKIIIDLMLQTRFGLLLRATGDNEQVVTALARNKGNMKIAGLIIANGLVALCGGVLTQQQRLFEISMGTGAMVLALASVIIGVNSLKRFEWLRPTTKTIIGTLVYKACYSLAISLGLRPGDMKLVTALLFLGILSAWIFKPRRVTHDA